MWSLWICFKVITLISFYTILLEILKISISNILGPEKRPHIPYKVVDEGSGRFRIEFTTVEVGSYVIDVTVNGLTVPNSPLIAKAYDAGLIKVILTYWYRIYSIFYGLCSDVNKNGRRVITIFQFKRNYIWNCFVRNNRMKKAQLFRD